MSETESKPSTQLLSEIEKADSKTLKDVTTVENPAAKHDMAMVFRKNIYILISLVKYVLIYFMQFGVAKFDKNKLKNVETVEKNVLPTADDIKDAKDAEKSH